MMNSDPENRKYMDEKISLRKIWLIFVTKIWVVILCGVIGAGVCSGIYTLRRQSTQGTQYAAVSKLYLVFGRDDSGNVYQEYNGYTWNDLMVTEPIIKYTEAELKNAGMPLDRDMIRRYTKAEILSDIRLLTVTVTAPDKKTADTLLKATDTALEKFGADSSELESVKTIEEDGAQLKVSDSHTAGAAGLGAAAAVILSLLVMWIIFVVSDRVYLPEDVRRRTGLPLADISFRKPDEALLAKCRRLYGIEDDRGGEAGSHLIYLTYGTDRTFMAEEQAAGMRAGGAEPAGFVITDADNRFYERYFRFRRQ